MLPCLRSALSASTALRGVRSSSQLVSASTSARPSSTLSSSANSNIAFSDSIQSSTSSGLHPDDIKDGRLTSPFGDTIGYAAVGPKDAPPLFFLHGFPSSRLEGATMGDWARRLHFRMITPDRPGIGLSTYDPHRRLLDYPAQISQLAKGLGYRDGYSVIGGSGGGPYALACAKRLPASELKSVGVLAGVGPLDGDNNKEGRRFGVRLMMKMFQFSPRFTGWLTDALIGRKARHPDRQVFRDALLFKLEWQMKYSNLRPDEKELLFKDNAKGLEDIIDCVREHFRQGPQGFVKEGQILSEPWGFRLEDVEREGVRFYFGAEDTNTPAKAGREMASKMKNAEYNEYPGQSHMTVVERHGDEILLDIMRHDK